MKTEFQKKLQQHEYLASCSGIAIVLFAFSLKFGLQALQLVPPGESVPEVKLAVFGTWALCLAGFALTQFFMRRSRAALNRLAS